MNQATVDWLVNSLYVSVPHGTDCIYLCIYLNFGLILFILEVLDHVREPDRQAVVTGTQRNRTLIMETTINRATSHFILWPSVL